MPLELSISPHGRLLVHESPAESAAAETAASDRIAAAFARGDSPSPRRRASLADRAEPGLAAGRAGHLSPGREQTRFGAPIRLPRDLHQPAVGPGSRPARTAGAGAARVRRGQEPIGAPVAA